MTNHTLAQSYLIKSTRRLRIGVEPPKQHDVGGLILEYRDRMPPKVEKIAGRLARISKWLRKEREFAFYGDVDFIPTDEYVREDGERAVKDAVFVVEAARMVIPE